MNPTHSIRELSTSADLEMTYPVMNELRPHLSFQDFISIYEEARQKDQYTLVGIFQDQELAGVMGYRVLIDYVHGRHLYIDDLVIKETLRSHGLGAELLTYAETVRGKLNCKGLRLSTGIDNHGGKRFYERHDWHLRSITYKKGF